MKAQRPALMLLLFRRDSKAALSDGSRCGSGGGRLCRGRDNVSKVDVADIPKAGSDLLVFISLYREREEAAGRLSDARLQAAHTRRHRDISGCAADGHLDRIPAGKDCNKSLQKGLLLRMIENGLGELAG